MTDGLSPDIFLQEAQDLLSEVEGIVLDLETDPDDREALNRLFRTMHTIKGSGAMFGFDAVAEFTHHVETALDHVREGHIPVDKRLIDLVLSAGDHIRLLLDEPDAANEAGRELIGEFQDLMPAAEKGDDGPMETGASPDDAAGPEEHGGLERYRIRFRPDPDIFKSGMDPARLIDEIRGLGECEATCRTGAVPPLATMDPGRCYLAFEMDLTTGGGVDAIHDVFLFVADDSEIDVRLLDPEPAGALPRTDAGPPPPIAAETAVQARPDADPDAGVVKANRRNARKPLADAQGGTGASTGIRVPSQKLDQLINLVGELLITQERISEVASRFDHIEEIKLLNMLSRKRREGMAAGRRDAVAAVWQRHGLLDRDLDPLTILDELAAGMTGPIETLKRLTGELRDTALNMRMVEIGTVFGKLRRLVRDLSRELGKEVELITEGGDAELDKTLIDRLNDPLVHLIRNSVDHGIQRPAVREAAGKPPRGTLRLTAFHREAHVVIEVTDDGRGIDLDAIRAKAVEAGLLAEGAELPESELLKLIFQPGLTTAGQLTKVSGRGVGMDVVKREIDAMGGTIAIDSRLGQYCRFTISLPLTLAIINGLLVEAGGERFVLPMAQVAECTELTPQMRRNVQGRDIFLLRGDIVPFIRINEVFESTPSPGASDHVVIVEFEGARIGLLVDAIIGDVQTVIKSLDQRCHRAECFSGATVLGDGSVVLVLDISGLIQCASHQAGAPAPIRS